MTTVRRLMLCCVLIASCGCESLRLGLGGGDSSTGQNSNRAAPAVAQIIVSIKASQPGQASIQPFIASGEVPLTAALSPMIADRFAVSYSPYDMRYRPESLTIAPVLKSDGTWGCRVDGTSAAVRVTETPGRIVLNINVVKR